MANAADACRPGDVITISTWQEEEKIAVAIKDNGTGIEPEKMGLIFQPFYTTKPTVKGTGLGYRYAMESLKTTKEKSVLRTNLEWAQPSPLFYLHLPEAGDSFLYQVDCSSLPPADQREEGVESCSVRSLKLLILAEISGEFSWSRLRATRKQDGTIALSLRDTSRTLYLPGRQLIISCRHLFSWDNSTPPLLRLPKRISSNS